VYTIYGGGAAAPTIDPSNGDIRVSITAAGTVSFEIQAEYPSTSNCKDSRYFTNYLRKPVQVKVVETVTRKQSTPVEKVIPQTATGNYVFDITNAVNK
jgi:hypothetical protein